MKTKIGRIVVDEGSNTLVVIDGPGAAAQMAAAINSLDMPTVTNVYELRYAKAADIKTKVAEVITKGVGSVQVDERTNKVIVTDLVRKMADIDKMVMAFDDKLQQVLIEAKIVQITLNDKYQLGVDWDAVLKKISKEISIKSAFQLAAKNALTPGAQLVIGTLDSGDSAVMIQALKEIGSADLLSSPRITALNNQEAKIMIGTSQPYATNTVTQSSTTATTGTNLNFIDIGIKLYVTPTINKDGFVTMKIKPEVSSASATPYTYGSPPTTVPVIQTTQAETSVTVKDNTTIIIGGLIKDERTNTVDKVPFLGDIPVFGEAFKKTVNEIKKQELVVFLTPHIITGENDYLENPKTEPIGEKIFTISEKPTFERRERHPMDSGMFKEPKTWPGEDPEAEQREEAAKKKAAAGKSVIMTAPEEYYYAVKGRIIEKVALPPLKKNLSKTGSVRLTFVLSPQGELIYGPEILKSSNHALDEPSLAAVKKAAPFPAFPKSLGSSEKRFAIDISFE